MKKNIIYDSALAFLISSPFILLIIFSMTGRKTNTFIEESATQEQVVTDQRVELWLSALEWCESRGDNNALNPEDLDGTPSYGRYQFKPGTLKMYALRYGILSDDREDEDWNNLVWDPEIQDQIVRRMIDDPKVNFNNEFPHCVKMIGLPYFSK